jgi:hypothetical protein
VELSSKRDELDRCSELLAEREHDLSEARKLTAAQTQQLTHAKDIETDYVQQIATLSAERSALISGKVEVGCVCGWLFVWGVGCLCAGVK